MTGGMVVKKTFCLLMLILFWIPVHAGIVTEEQARRCAADFFAAAQVHTKSETVRPEDFKLVCTFPEVRTKTPGMAPALYVFERAAGGYAVVSGDDVARPVLGYSLGGQFPGAEMPENLRDLLQWYADIIAYAREQHWESASDMESDAGLDPAQTVQLQTAKWSQGPPFNDLVAEINGNKPPIGCTATAIAIIMRYHKWPKRGTGTLPSYEYKKDGVTYHVDGFDLGHEYDWDKMPEDYRNCSTEAAAQIARLLYDVAVMCKMTFYPGGSGAFAEIGAQRLTEYFGYDKRVRYFRRSDGLSDLEWESRVIDEINAGRPALYVGYADIGGHSFVIDGYNGRYFSINYGWGGGTSGREGHDYYGQFKDFYTLTPIEGHAEDLLVFNDSQSLTTHIMPDAGGAPEPVLIAYSYGSGKGLSPSFEAGKDFRLEGYFRNNSLGSFTLDFAYVLYDSRGKAKETVSQVFRRSIGVGETTGTSPQTCKITKALADGDKIDLAMKDPASGKWTPLIQSRAYEIAFTSRPLQELVEIGYREPSEPRGQAPEPDRDIYLKLYKDLVWSLTSAADPSTILASGDQYHDWYWEDHIVQRVLFPDTQDFALLELWLPSGTYHLWLHNPLTGEKMTISLEL